jgi:phosphohistidine phosphatase
MKFLFVIRHAKSSWDDAAVADIDRPLNARGRRDAEEMAQRLHKKTSSVNAFISSPANRARSTAEQFALAFGKERNEIVVEQGLYLAPVSFFLELLSSLDNHLESVAIFAHNPGITDFVNSLTAAVNTDNVPTCGVFGVKASIDNWREFAAAKKDLLFYDYPKLGA